MNIKTIAVGVDFSELSLAACEWAVAIARRCDARVVLLHAGMLPHKPEGAPASMEGVTSEWEDVLRARYHDTQHKLEELRARFDLGDRISQSVIEDFADTGLVEAASEIAADLLVLGTHGRSGVSRWVLGSVAERVVRLAACDVLVVRGAPAAQANRLFVPTDFSEVSDEALARAIGFARAGDHIDVMHFWSVPGSYTWYWDSVVSNAALLDGVRDDLRSAIHDKLAQLPVAPAGVVTHKDHSEIDPKTGLREWFDGHPDTSCVFMGCQGHRGIARVLLGSVAEYAVRHAPCAVWVCRKRV